MLDFKLNRIFGCLYKTGNLEYTHDHRGLLSISGSRVVLTDIASQETRVIRAQGRSDLAQIALSPSEIFQVDSEGYGQFVHLRTQIVKMHMNFKEQVSCASYSPGGEFFAVALGCKLRVFQVSDTVLLPHLSFSSWHSDIINSLNWIKGYLVTSSKDMTVRFLKLQKDAGYIPITLTGHRREILGTWAHEDKVYTVSADGRVFAWQWADPSDAYKHAQEVDYTRRIGKKKQCDMSERLILLNKYQLSHEGSGRITCAHMTMQLLAVGFKAGSFAIYKVTETAIDNIQTLSMTDFEISCIRTSPDWIAIGSQKLGQVLVWEWKSETYVIKQQGHSSEITSVAEQNNIIATGGIDGKIKLWEKGITFASFQDHIGEITGLRFVKPGVLVSCGKDGTVHAYDTTRYKKFRNYRCQSPLAAIAYSGEIICAGGESGDVYVLSLQTGIHCDTLSGHTGPITCMEFTPAGILISGSWDKTIRAWNVFDRKANFYALEHSSEVLALTVHPKGREVAVATDNGNITYWDIEDEIEKAIIEGKRDVAGGRGDSDRFTADSNPSNKKFNSISFSPDGTLLLAAGESKYVCLYDLRAKILLRKLSFTENRSLSGVLRKLNTKDIGRRRISDKVRATGLIFSGMGFHLVTPEGVLEYTAEDRFLPINLTVGVSYQSVIKALKKKSFTAAMTQALALNEETLIRELLYRVPLKLIPQVGNGLTITELLGKVLAGEIKTGRELGVILTWVKAIKTNNKELQRELNTKYQELSQISQDNFYMLKFLTS